MTWRLDTAYAGSPMTVIISGRFTNNTGGNINTLNYQLTPGATSYTATPGVFNLTPPTIVQPPSSKVTVFANPRGGTAGAAGNYNAIPVGLPTANNPTGGSEFVLDVGGFPGEIIYADCNVVSNSRGNAPAAGYISGIDQINLNVFIQIMTANGGSQTALPAGASVCWRVAIKDSIGV